MAMYISADVQLTGACADRHTLRRRKIEKAIVFLMDKKLFSEYKSCWQSTFAANKEKSGNKGRWKVFNRTLTILLYFRAL
jgi:hypothetical protein